MHPLWTPPPVAAAALFRLDAAPVTVKIPLIGKTKQRASTQQKASDSFQQRSLALRSQAGLSRLKLLNGAGLRVACLIDAAAERAPAMQDACGEPAGGQGGTFQSVLPLFHHYTTFTQRDI